MAGHSHWHNIRHKKDRQDAIKAKNNRRYSQEIMSAIQKGGNNLDYNPFAKAIIALAKSNGVSREVIDKAIKKASDTKFTVGESVLYEIFYKNGIAIIVTGFAESLAKASAQIKEIVSKYSGELSKCNHLFIYEGIAEITNCKINTILDFVGDFIQDFDESERDLIITFDVNHLTTIQEKLQQFSVTRCETIYRATDFIQLPEPDLRLQKMIEALEGLEFVQSVFHNIDL